MAKNFWQKIIKLGMLVCTYDEAYEQFKIARIWSKNDPSDDVIDNELVRQDDLIGHPITKIAAFDRPEIASLLKTVYQSDKGAIERTIPLGAVSLGIVQNMRLTVAKATQKDLVINVIEVITKQTKSGVAEDSHSDNESLLNQLPMRICKLLPGNFTITFANKEYCDSFGIGINDAIGGSLLNVVDVQDHDQLRTNIGMLDWDMPRVACKIHVQTNKGMQLQQWTIQALFNQRGDITDYVAYGINC